MPRFNFNDGSYYDFERFTTLNRNTTNRWGQVAYVYYFSENEAKNAGYVTIPENILTPLSAKVRDWSYHHYGYNKTQAIKNAVEEYDKGEVIPGQPNPYIVTAGLICHRQNFSGLPFATPAFLTFNQIKKAGATIKPGEEKKHYPVFYWKWLEKVNARVS